MRASFINDPSHWRERAEAMRTLANEVKTGDAKLAMLRVASDYECLAGRAEQRAKSLSWQAVHYLPPSPELEFTRGLLGLNRR
jgi:hypothetical protein